MAEPDSNGAEILALQRDIKLLRPWLTDLQRQRILDLQLALDAKAGQAGATRTVCDELRTEIAWRASEIDGCQRALELVPVPVGGGMTEGSSEARLIRKMERRAAEIVELETQVARLVELERRRSLDHDIAEQRLLDGLRAIGSEAKAARNTDRRVRRQRWMARSLTPVSEDEMWSPAPVVGYRMWAVHDDELHGAWTPWPTNHFVATCQKEGPVPHTDGICAEVAFGCGVYAAKSVRDLISSYGMTEQTSAVVGLVAMAGRVVEHTKGYRAEEATVVAAVVLGRTADAHSSIRLVTDETEVEGLFLDWRGTARDGPGEELLPRSTNEMIVMIEQFMTERARKRDIWT
jgi:hypothetical protein